MPGERQAEWWLQGLAQGELAVGVPVQPGAESSPEARAELWTTAAHGQEEAGLGQVGQQSTGDHGGPAEHRRSQWARNKLPLKNRLPLRIKMTRPRMGPWMGKRNTRNSYMAIETRKRPSMGSELPLCPEPARP